MSEGAAGSAELKLIAAVPYDTFHYCFLMSLPPFLTYVLPCLKFGAQQIVLSAGGFHSHSDNFSCIFTPNLTVIPCQKHSFHSSRLFKVHI